MSEALVLFISHTEADRPLADALRRALDTLIDHSPALQVASSTDHERGPQAGQDWRDWIHEQVARQQRAIIVLSPHALGKPWVLWEAGACWGVARGAQRSDAAGALIPVAYGLNENECPDPLRSGQIVNGTRRESVEALFDQLLDALDLPPRQRGAAGKRMEAVLTDYLASVQAALLRRPSLVTEANVQDWLARLDELLHGQRYSELPEFERWLMLAFGRDTDDTAPAAQRAIDVRLHRRLGEAYRGQKRFGAAVSQLRLAWYLAPRDIYVLRPLAEVTMKRLLEDGSDPEGQLGRELDTLLKVVADLDPQYQDTPDSAALYAKYLRKVKQQPAEADAVLARCLEKNPDSYYLADLLAQAHLAEGQHDDARRVYGQALDILSRVRDQNPWTQATAAAAHLVLGRPEEASQRFREAVALKPPPADVETILSGLRTVARHAGIDEPTLQSVISSKALS